MWSSVPLSNKQRKAMRPYQQNVGAVYRTLDWLRDSILNENQEEFRTALRDLRHRLTELEELVSQNAVVGAPLMESPSSSQQNLATEPESKSEKVPTSESERSCGKLSPEDGAAVAKDLRNWMEQGLRSPVMRPAFLGFDFDQFVFSSHIFECNPLPEFCWLSVTMLDCFATALLSAPDVQSPPIRVVLRCRLGEQSGRLCLFLVAMLSAGEQVLPIHMTTVSEVWIGSHLRSLAKAKGITLGNIFWDRSGAHSFFFFDYPGQLVRARVPGLGELGRDGKARWPECDLGLNQIDTAMREKAAHTIKLIDADPDHGVQ